MMVLALPVVADQIGMMSMGLVDTIMVGRLGAGELGAVGVTSAVYFFYMVFCYGMVSAVGPTVAQAYGARNHAEIEQSTGQAFWIALGMAAIGVAIMSAIGPILELLGQPSELLPLAEDYASTLRWGIPATLSYAVLRSFAVGLGRTRVTMVISLIAALLNAVLDYALIYGRFGAPEMGVAGAGLATTIVQWFMLALLVVFTLRLRELRAYRYYRHILRPRPAMLARLARLGAPIGGSNSLEVGIFALTALFMGQIGKLALASHQIAINVAAFTFMIPLGISTAITTRVGQFVGARQFASARLAGWVGIAMSAGVMAFTALAFLTIPGTIIAAYTNDPAVIGYATGLILIAGAFQIFDGIQVATLGALRGLKDTSRPMLVNLLAYWFVGMPTGYLLAFHAGMEGPGLWWGLTAGLGVAALLHTIRFRRLISPTAPAA